jgi:hypothetical protein
MKKKVCNGVKCWEKNLMGNNTEKISSLIFSSRLCPVNYYITLIKKYCIIVDAPKEKLWNGTSSFEQWRVKRTNSYAAPLELVPFSLYRPNELVTIFIQARQLLLELLQWYKKSRRQNSSKHVNLFGWVRYRNESTLENLKYWALSPQFSSIFFLIF